MKIERLQDLSRKLAKEADLSKIWLFYMNNFADHEQFFKFGQPAQNEYLNTVVYKTCQQIFAKAIFSKSITISSPFLIHIPKYQFFHGPFKVGESMGGMIYFEDIKIGLIAIPDQSSRSGLMQYSRFSEVAKFSSPNRHDLN